MTIAGNTFAHPPAQASAAESSPSALLLENVIIARHEFIEMIGTTSTMEGYCVTIAQGILSLTSFLSILGAMKSKIFLICSGNRAFKKPR